MIKIIPSSNTEHCGGCDTPCLKASRIGDLIAQAWGTGAEE